jgi:hypothetical protein
MCPFLVSIGNGVTLCSCPLLRLPSARSKHSQLHWWELLYLLFNCSSTFLSSHAALFSPMTSMPRKWHPCIKILIAAIECRTLNIRQTASQIFDLCPIINATCKGDKNQSWMRAYKQGLVKQKLRGTSTNRTGSGQPPASSKRSKDKVHSGTRSNNTSFRQITPKDKSPLDDKSPLIILSKMDLMLGTESLMSTEQLPQTSKQSVFLGNKHL